MTKTAFYPLNKVNTAAHFTLKRCRGGFEVGPGVLISEQAMAEAGGKAKLYRVDWKYVSSVRGEVKLPAIHLVSHSCAAFKMYISGSELRAMQKCYNVLPSALNGATFMFHPGSNVQNVEFKIAPRWDELMDPEWRKVFLAWVAGKRENLPDPSAIRWRSWPGRKITMPGIADPQDICQGAKELAEGDLSFKRSGGLPQAYFDCGDEYISYYRLSYDGRAVRYFSEYLGYIVSGEDFEKTTFDRLFGAAPTLHEYGCIKKAAKNCVYFGVTQNKPIVLTDSNGNLQSDSPYYWTFERKGLRLFIELRRKKEDNVPWARAMVNLTGGYFYGSSVALQFE
jgi:hypothetical protein